MSQPTVVISPDVHRLRLQVENHAVFGALADMDALRRFMQVHVFAVWDFMSLTKRLQRDLTCQELPWMPPPDRQAARMINEIVLGEESDEGPDGAPISHLDLYLDAMREAGASTHSFDDFLDALRAGAAPRYALREAKAPAFVADFVGHTLSTALHGSTLEVLASFLFGRENVIPAMFRSLLRNWNLSPVSVPAFNHYLQRHIELDGDSHGPLAMRVLETQVAHSSRRLSEARVAARASLQARLDLWDGTLALLQAAASAPTMALQPALA